MLKIILCLFTLLLPQLSAEISDEEFSKLRNNENAHKMFMKVFVKEVVGRRPFADRLHSGLSNIDKLATRTDEGFALLVVENSEACCFSSSLQVVVSL